MADTTSPTSASTSGSTTNDSGLPVINLDALQGENTQATENVVVGTQNTDTNSVTPESTQITEGLIPEVPVNPIQENTPSEATPVTEDPFEGLNIVLGEATSNEPGANTTTTPSESFVDPFLNPKKTEVSEVVPVEESNLVGETTVSESETTETANSSSEPINLDTMLASVDSSTSVIAPSTNGLSDKKRKMIMIGSGIIGIVVLAAASYFVFSTMYPSGMGLSADVSGDPQGTTSTGSNTGTEKLPDPLAAGNTYKPDATTATPEIDPNTIENNTEKEDELSNTPAESFGKEDELPPGAGEIKTGTKADNNATETGSNEEELPSDVKPEVSKAIEDLNRKIEGAKQLLTLLRTKPNPEQTKELAGIIKEIKSILTKLNSNGFTSFTEEIEKPMTDLGFRYDKLTSAIVGN